MHRLGSDCRMKTPIRLWITTTSARCTRGKESKKLRKMQETKRQKKETRRRELSKSSSAVVYSTSRISRRKGRNRMARLNGYSKNGTRLYSLTSIQMLLLLLPSFTRRFSMK